MVYRRKRFYRRKPIRHTYKRKYFKRVHKPFGSGFMAKRFFKLKQFLELSQTGTNAIVTTVHDNPANAVDLSGVRDLFDCYRVNAIKLKFIPAWTAQTLQTATSVRFRAAYIFHDINHALDFPKHSYKR